MGAVAGGRMMEGSSRSERRKMHPVQSNRQAPYNTKGQKGLSLAKYIKKKKKEKGGIIPNGRKIMMLMFKVIFLQC